MNFLIYLFIILDISKKSVLNAYIILYYKFVILFLICLIHLNLENISMDSMCEIPF